MAAKNQLLLSEIALAVLVFTIIVFSYRSGWTIISHASGYLLVAVFAYESLFRIKQFKFVIPLPLAVFFTFVMYALVSLIWTNQSINMMFTLINLFVVSFIIINIIHHQGRIQAITYGFLSALLVTSVDVMLETGGVASLNDSDRISSYLGNANTFASALVIGIILVVDALSRKSEHSGARTVLGKVMLLFMLLLFSYEIMFLSGSRKGMISVFLIIFFYFIRNWLNADLIKKVWITATGAGILFGLYHIVKESVFFERLSRVFLLLSGENVKEGSLNERAAMISDAIGFWREKPITGWGTDQFRYISDYNTYSHNNYVELLSNNGVIGIVLYYLILLLILISAIRLMVSRIELSKYYGWFSLTAIIIFFLWDVAYVSYYSKLNWVMMSVVIGMTYYVTRKQQQKSAH